MTEYTRRQRRQITRHALHRLAMASDAEASQETRDIARAELQRLYRQDDEPAHDLREPYVARFTVQPGLHLTVDASHNIILEVRMPDESELLAAYALGDVAGFRHLLDRAHSARDEAEGRMPMTRQLAAWLRTHPGAPDHRAAELPGQLTGADETRWEDPRDTEHGQTSVPDELS